ncbi:MAG: HAD hydrolase family protein [Candidatus Aegiribacteria sp.]|nr:HAD hydrolase family protein [Candidatus Aegiribacteria sp.]
MIKLEGIRLLALDIDGVLTDGGLYYGSEGIIQKFNSADGAGIIELRKRGFPIALVSFRDFPSTRRRAADLGIEILCLGTDEKAAALENICRHLSIDCEAAIFMGDGLLDLPAIRSAGIGACPSSAHSLVQAECDIITKMAGGKGAVREVVDMLLESLKDG